MEILLEKLIDSCGIQITNTSVQAFAYLKLNTVLILVYSTWGT